MLDKKPTVRARYIGQELSRAMTAAGLGVSELARRFGCSQPKIRRMISGKRLPDRTHLSAFLALCGVPAPRWNIVLDLADDPYHPCWWRDYGDRVPVQVPERDQLETEASTIVCYADTVVPDLLRTAAYTRAVLRANPAIPGDEINGRVADTLRRQTVLDRPAAPELRGATYAPVRPELVVFLDEYVLTRTGIGEDIRSNMAHHLLRLAIRPDVHIRVIPHGSTGGIEPFTLFRFPTYQPVVFLEQPTSAGYLEEPAMVGVYETGLSMLHEAALDTKRTRVWLAEAGRGRSPHGGSW